MPGLPLVARETTFSRSRSNDQMCRQNFCHNFSPEEALAAEESLSVYCKPVELYNILLRRASYNPLFLQRCLNYKIQARHNRRIRITVSIPSNTSNELWSPNLSPLYIFLARPVTEPSQSEGTSVYRLCRVCKVDAVNQTESSFVVPELRKLSTDVRCRNLTLIILSHGEESCNQSLITDGDDHGSFPQKLVGNYMWGKILLESILSSPEMDANLNLGQRIELLSSADMYPCTLEPTFLDVNHLIRLRRPHTSATEDMANQMRLSISACETGSSDRSPYDSHLYDDLPPNIIRLRAGNVIFNYKYYHNSLQKTEVTEDFSCPFCLVRCSSFKGLRYHLTSSHDLFNFEFWVSEDYQAVNVSVKADIWRSEILADGIDPRMQTFNYRSRKNRRRRVEISGPSARNVHLLPVASDLPGVLRDSSRSDQIEEVNGESTPLEGRCPRAIPHGHLSKFPRYEGDFLDASEECVEHSAICAASALSVDECSQPLSAASASPQLGKTRKIPVDRPDPKIRTLLQKRLFFHSHRAQAMALEQVLSDRDSEDEVDDDIADLEDRRMLDDFVDVTKDEKRIMHLWNSFVRRQRVLADGHIPWACEAFTKLHGPDFIKEPALLWCWRLFMIKLWNHSLLDARSMNSCNLLLEKFQHADSNSNSS